MSLKTNTLKSQKTVIIKIHGNQVFLSIIGSAINANYLIGNVKDKNGNAKISPLSKPLHNPTLTEACDLK